MMKLCLYTPGLADHNSNPSDNLGDLIIQEAVERELKQVFSDIDFLRLPSHIFPKKEHVASIHACQMAVVGGSNLLESQMDRHKKWQVSWRQQLFAPSPVLLGVGWRVYQQEPNFYTRIFLKGVLSSKWLHSVRDSYTLKKVQATGIKNVLNTGCPTMWPFLEFDFKRIPTTKADHALVMLTDYEKDPQADKQLLETLAQAYNKVIIWPQGKGDEQYANALIQEIPGEWEMLEHSYEAFTHLLASDMKFDYVGTRLHGGIKCLLSGRRGLVVEIDNRAKEIAQDTGLPTVERGDIETLHQWIEGSAHPQITLNQKNISAWRSQFVEAHQTNAFPSLINLAQVIKGY